MDMLLFLVWTMNKRRTHFNSFLIILFSCIIKLTRPIDITKMSSIACNITIYQSTVTYNLHK